MCFLAQEHVKTVLALAKDHILHLSLFTTKGIVLHLALAFLLKFLLAMLRFSLNIIASTLDFYINASLISLFRQQAILTETIQL